jgi:hypothetical protein
MWGMARGWESKAVEGQIQESELKSSDNPRPQLTQAQLEVSRRKQVLILSRKRVEKDLEASRDQRYRDQLNRALADLDAQLSELAETV